MVYWFYKVRREDIYLIKNIVEAFEDIMNISTIDKDLPKIQLTIAPDFVNDARSILDDLEKRFLMIRLNEPENISQGKY